MKNLFKKPLFYLSAVLILVLGFTTYNIVSALQFEEPSSSFPEGNPSTPLTTDILSTSTMQFTGNSRSVISLQDGHNIKMGSNFFASRDNGMSFNGELKMTDDINMSGNNLRNVSQINGTNVDDIGGGISGAERVQNSNYYDDPPSYTSVSVSCPSGKKVMSGGCAGPTGDDFSIIENWSDTENSWSCEFDTTDRSQSGTFYAKALCADFSPADSVPSEAEECKDAGGSMVDSGGNNTTSESEYSFCRFSVSEYECPSGWTQNENWTTTQDVQCQGNGDSRCGFTGTQTLEGHDWANEGVEQLRVEQWEDQVEDCVADYTCYANVIEIGCNIQ